MPGADAADEFETIHRLLKPLAHPEYARGLVDDVAVLPSRPGFDLVVTKDAIVEGVHFLATDPLDAVAKKLLRVNLSDLAAKGAEPFGYLLACHWSKRCGWAEREAFAAGLAEDQATFGVHLLGGDTVVTPGPASFSVTMLGWIPKGRAVGRSGAAPGDLVYVTGTIGDGGLGLRAAQGRLGLEPERIEALVSHYRTPQPRVDFARAIRDLATASIDVSDGLLADLGHIAAASGVGMTIELTHVPLSMAAQAWMDDRVDPEAALADLAAAGDDYEIALTVSPGHETALRRAAEELRLRLTLVGRVERGRGLDVRYQGQPAVVTKTGWRHA